MDVGATNGWRMDDVVPAAEIVARDRRASSRSIAADANYTGEVAERWRYRDGSGEIGVIASVTQAFCRDCTRARLSTDGKLYTCLFATDGYDLRALVREGASDEQLRNADRRDLAAARRPLFGDPHRGDAARAEGRDELHRRLGADTAPAPAHGHALPPRPHRRRAPRDVQRPRGRRARRDARRRDRRRASADALRRQAGAADADDARRRARGAHHRLPAQPAARAIRSRTSCRCRSTGKSTRCR